MTDQPPLSDAELEALEQAAQASIPLRSPEWDSLRQQWVDREWPWSAGNAVGVADSEDAGGPEDKPRPTWDYLAAANPATILRLIAEVRRLRATASDEVAEPDPLQVWNRYTRDEVNDLIREHIDNNYPGGYTHARLRRTGNPVVMVLVNGQRNDAETAIRNYGLTRHEFVAALHFGLRHRDVMDAVERVNRSLSAAYTFEP